MSEVGKQLILKSKIPPAQREEFMRQINALSDELGICQDWLYIIMMTEASLNPHALNYAGCGGLIQFCPGTAEEITGMSGAAVSKLSAVQQVPLIRKYLLNKGKRPPAGADLGSAYLSILFPAYRNMPRNRVIPAGKQARHLYANGVITKESIEKGLFKHAGVTPGNGPNGCSGSVNSPSASPLSESPPSNSSSFPSGLGLYQLIKCLPWDYTMATAKIYAGCEVMALNNTGLGGGTTTAPTGGAIPQTVPLPPSDASTAPIPPGEGTWLNPCVRAVVTSQFGPRRVRGGSSNHQGIDLATVPRTPIVATRSGKVSAIHTGCSPMGGRPGDTCGGKGGNWVRIEHEGGYQSRYLHLYDVFVRTGQQVKQGEKIGTMGNSGSSTGTHLHFEIRSGGGAKPLNPYPLIKPTPGGKRP